MKQVFYDLNESYYFSDISDMRFYFSSSFNKKRFEERYQEFIKCEEDKINAKYGIKLILKNYLLLSFYTKIEKRGFRAYTRNAETELIPLSHDTFYFTEVNLNDFTN